tara:strand:+ start:130 stop:393 length:264 start_codon:yes stop_codon:yes gene_type:complete
MVWQKKRVGRKATARTWTPEEMKAVGWCLSNNIFISCIPNWKEKGINWFIDIMINKNVHRDPNTYEDEEVFNKIYKYYKYYYDKHKK